MRFPPQFLDEIRARLPLSTVIGPRVAWDKRKSMPARGDYWACCPFHNEKSPSFHCEDRKGFYHCFGCKASGDHVKFLTEKEGMSFTDAVTKLAEMAGLPLPQQDPETERRYKAEAGLHEVMEMATAWFEANLQSREGATARGYLSRRRMGGDVQKRFRLGYAGPSRNALKEHLAAKGVSLEKMIEAGLLVAGDDVPVAFDRFRDRVIFPISDARGRIVAFGGRALAADAPAKYLNSPETPIFSKGSLLYNFAPARKAADAAGTLVVVEGYVDVIACVTAGIEHVVAPLGTALTERQLGGLWQVADEPILCFDGDGAGQRAARRVIDLALPALKPGKSLRFAVLPEGQDPDDLIGEGGREAMAAVLGQASPLVEAIWARETEGGVFETPERRADLQKRLRDIARGIGDPDVSRNYDQAFRERVEAFFGQRRPAAPNGGWRGQNGREWQARGNAGPRGAGAKWGRGRQQGPEPAGQVTPVSDRLSQLSKRGRANQPLREAVIVMTAVNQPALLAQRLDEFADIDLMSREIDNLRRQVLSVVCEEPSVTTEQLLRHLDAIGLSSFIARLDAQLAHSGTWQARAGAAERDAEDGWLQAMSLQKKTRTLHKELKEAENALATELSDANLARMLEIKDQLASTEGTEAQIKGFGTSSGRQAGSL